MRFALGRVIHMHQRPHSRLLRSLVAVSGTFALAGCSRSPSLNILGSFFPSWMLCAIAGLVLAILLRQGFAAAGIDKGIPVPLLVYLAITTAFSFLFWLIWLG